MNRQAVCNNKKNTCDTMDIILRVGSRNTSNIGQTFQNPKINQNTF